MDEQKKVLLFVFECLAYILLCHFLSKNNKPLRTDTYEYIRADTVSVTSLSGVLGNLECLNLINGDIFLIGNLKLNLQKLDHSVQKALWIRLIDKISDIRSTPPVCITMCSSIKHWIDIPKWATRWSCCFAPKQIDLLEFYNTNHYIRPSNDSDDSSYLRYPRL